MPSIRVTQDSYIGLKKMIASGYSKTISGVIDRFLREEGITTQESAENTPEKQNTESQNKNHFLMAQAGPTSSTKNDGEAWELLGDFIKKYRYQRDAMRAVYWKCKKNHNQTIKLYSWLEDHGYVKRKNNRHNFSSKYYAEALFKDGLAKGWIEISPESAEWLKEETEELGIKIQPFDQDVEIK
jgi:hypothetical protein